MWRLLAYLFFLIPSLSSADYPAVPTGACFSPGSIKYSYSWPYICCTNSTKNDCASNRYHTVLSCPSGGTLSGSTCLQSPCPTGQVRDSSGVCIADCSSKTGKSVQAYTTASSPGYSLSIDGCLAVLSRADNQCKVGGTPAICGTWVYDGTYAPPGSTTAIAGQPDASICPSGQCPGTFNGASICLPCASSPDAKTFSSSQKTTTGPDGSVTKQDISTTFSDGKVLTTTTTTTTINNSTTSTTEIKEQDAPGFCEENPDLAICKDSVANSSDCGAPPTCQGDAIQCAILDQTWRNRCETTPETLKYDAAVGSEAALKSQLTGSVVDIGVLDQSRHFASSCPADASFEILGFSGHIPYSSICPYLVIFGNLGAAVALFFGIKTALA